MFKKCISMLLVLAMIIGVLAAAPFTVNAAKADVAATGDESYADDVALVPVYFINLYQWDEVWAFTWGDPGAGNFDWPGFRMEYVGKDADGYDVYTAMVPKQAEGLLFDNGNNGYQTQDINESATIIKNALWYPIGNGGGYGNGAELKYKKFSDLTASYVDPEDVPDLTDTLYFINVLDWDDVRICTYDTYGDEILVSTKMTKVGTDPCGKDIYTADLRKTVDYICFGNGEEGMRTPMVGRYDGDGFDDNVGWYPYIYSNGGIRLKRFTYSGIPETPEASYVAAADIPEFITVYFINTPNWEKVYVHSWNNHLVDWFGTPMEYVRDEATTGYKIYKATIPKPNEGILFNAGNNDYYYGQTGDISASEVVDNKGWYPKDDDLSDGFDTDDLATFTYSDDFTLSEEVFPTFRYSESSTYVTITKYRGTDQKVTIPSVINEKPVTRIGSNCFKDNTFITSVTIPDSVTTIYSKAFYGCTALESVTIPNSITNVDYDSWEHTGPFSGCTALKTIHFAENITTIPNRLFYGCDGLEEVTIPAGVITVGAYAFQYCSNLEKVTLADSVTTVGSYAFGDCPKLTDVTLSANLQTLNERVFSYCAALESITIPKTLTNASYPFDGCSALKTITFAENTTAIPNNLFNNCDGLETVTLPETIISIGSGAFRYCDNLTTVTLSDYVTTVGSYAFADCPKLATVTLSASLTTINERAFQNCIALASITIPKYLTSASYSFEGCTALSEVAFEDGTQKVADGLFRSCSGLKTVTLPESVTTIGNSSFRDCTALETVNFSNSLTSIGSYAFCGCSALTTLELPEYLTTISNSAFNSCTALATLTLPVKLESVGDSAFYDCGALKKVTFAEGVTRIPSNIFNNTTIEEIVFPSTLQTIGSYAFSNNPSLTSVDLPDGLLSIEQSAFYSCTALTEIEIPDSVTSVGNSVFEDCTALASAHLSDGCTVIPYELFNGCIALTDVEIPATVTSIGSYAFNGCTSLTAITLPAALQTIDNNAFYGCTKLADAALPEKLVTINSNAFYNCDALTAVAFPATLKTLGSYAFSNCDSLESVSFKDYSISEISNNVFDQDLKLASVVIPNGVTRIRDYAFRNNYALTEVTIPASVTSISNNEVFTYKAMMTIKGFGGSYAETYANDNGIKFEDISIPAEGIALTEAFNQYYDEATDTYRITLKRGESITVDFEFYPSDCNDTVTLASSNTSVARVNMLTISTYNYNGDATITATTSSGMTFDFYVHVIGVNRVEVDTLPDKTLYLTGEDFDPTGFKLNVIYSDNTVETAPEGSYTITGYDPTVNAVQSLTATYTAPNGYTYQTRFNVEVVSEHGHLTGIAVKTLPDKVKYVRRDPLDTTGLVVVETYDSGDEVVLTEDQYTVSGYNALKNGKQVLTVTAGNYSARFAVKVYASAAAIPESDPDTPPADKTFYMVGNMNNWYARDKYALTLVESADSYEYVLKTYLNENNRFRIADSDDKQYPSSENYYTVIKSGIYLIHFRPDGDGRTSQWFEGFFYPEFTDEQEYYLYGDYNDWTIGDSDSRFVRTDNAECVEYEVVVTIPKNSSISVTDSTGSTNILSNQYYPSNILSGRKVKVLFRPNGDGGEGWHENKLYICPDVLEDEELMPNKPLTVSIPENTTVFFRFIPDKTTEYSFYSESNADTYGVLYDANLNQLAANDDGGDDSNFRIENQTLTAGNVYYLAVHEYNDNAAEISVTAYRYEDPTETYLIGDVDGNGEVTIVDATVLQRILADMSTSVKDVEKAKIRGDVNKNNELDIIDATLIQRHLADLSVAYPVGVEDVYPTA